MKKPSFFLGLVFILLPLRAIAGESEPTTYPVNFEEINRQLPLKVMPKQECVSVLETAFHPEETIAAGLNALETSQKQSPMQSCLTELVNSLSPDFSSLQNSLPPPEAGKAAAFLAELNQKKNCYNPYAPGDYPYSSKQNFIATNCGGKAIDQATYKKLDAERAAFEKLQSLFQKLPGTMATGTADASLATKINSKIQYCGPNPHAKGDYYYQSYAKNQASNCDGPLSEKEIAALKSQLAALNEKYEQDLKAAQQLQQKLGKALSNGYNLTDEIFDRREELQPLVRAVICTSPHEPGSNQELYWKQSLQSYGFCEGQFAKKSELPAARANLLAALGDLDELIARNKANQEEAAKQQDLKVMALTGSFTQRYVYKRLFANYQGYDQRMGTTGSIADFCENNERENRRDARFARTQMPGTGLPQPSAFLGDRAWLHAKYGFTEAEYKAMEMYVGSFYRRINEPLYKHEPLSPELTLYKEVLDSALKKLPTFSGAPLQRHLTLPQSGIDAHRLNEIVTYDAYTSTTKAQNWSWSGNARLLIYGGKNAKDVSKYNSSEQEVIFLPGTRFRVIGKESTNGGITKLVLGEVDENGDLVAKLPVPADYSP